MYYMNYKRTGAVLNKPTAFNERAFGELFGEISDNWEDKARRLQLRRWKHLRRLS